MTVDWWVDRKDLESDATMVAQTVDWWVDRKDLESVEMSVRGWVKG